VSASLFCSGLAASFGARPLFAGLDLTLAPGDVTALVGPNGSGKTTLLRILAGEHTPDSGSVRLAPPDTSVGYLPQSAPLATESVLDYALRRTGVGRASAEFELAAGRLADDEPGTDDAYARAFEHWLALGGADLESRLTATLAQLGLDTEPARPLGTLSGGQAARVGLASILVSQYDVLLLDEPTNNLDLDGLRAMTTFVTAQRSPILIASHDRAFLDTVATSVLELDPHQESVNTYAGGWTDYRAAKALARGQAEDAYLAYTERRDALTGGARRQNEWAALGRAKAAKLGPHSQLAKKHAGDQARRMDQRAARARDAATRLPEVEQPRKEWGLRYTIAEAPPSAELVVSLDAVVVEIGDFTLGPVSTEIVRGDRIALVGPNGSGKSTLVSALLGVREPSAGRISWGTRTRIGSLDQERTLIAGQASLLELVGDLLGTDQSATRTLLAKFGLGAEHIDRPCASLSLGERTRATLAVLQGRAVNVLVLDEPTNHLDVEGIEQLEQALLAFGGTLLIVTHDQALLDAIAPTQWIFERRGDRGMMTSGPPGLVHPGDGPS